MPNSSTVLAQTTNNGYELPVIEIPKWTRPAAQIQRRIREGWELAGVVLRLFPCSAKRTSWAAVEALNSKGITDLEEVALSQLSTGQLDEQEVEQLGLLLNGKSQGGPFDRLGWIDEAIRWVETASGRTLASRSDIEQLNAGGHFALLRFPTKEGNEYWMKATGEPNVHELSVTTSLWKLLGKHLPEVIAVRSAWNAWISSGDASPIWELPNDPEHLFSLLERVVLSMAELQIGTIGRTRDLSEAGAFDQSVERVRASSDDMFRFLAEAMRNQISAKVLPVSTKRLHELQFIFNKSCDRIEALEIPKTILHGDLNRGNILLEGEQCQFIDWSEAYVGFPFSSLEHLLLLNKIDVPSQRDAVNRCLRRRYREAWSVVCDPARIEEALALAPVLAIASALYGRGDWLCSASRLLPERQSYARTLARYMDRAASAPEFLEALCTD